MRGAKLLWRIGAPLGAILLIASCPGIGTASATRTASPSTGGLQLINTQRLSDRLTELTFTTTAVAGPTHVRILTPEGYDQSAPTRYPVLWLLHGADDSYKSWTDKGNAAAFTASDPVIVVMPDSGPDGGYINWFNGGKGGPPAWETYHIDQLLPWVDAHYRTIAERSERAIAGLSMGGGGAMTYAARHPDLFGDGASFSGAVDSNNPEEWPLVELGNYNGQLGQVQGDRIAEEVLWRGHNPWDLADNLGNLTLLQIDTGNGLPGGPGHDLGDPIEAGVHAMSVSFNQRLNELGIAHVWDDYGAGGHQWFYWKRDLQQFLPPLMQAFLHPDPAPIGFTYKAIDPSYSVYGWDVQIHRPALEFSRLQTSGPKGFTLTGSGSALVHTAGYYQPDSWHDVELRGSGGDQRVRLRAGDDGRLLVPVFMGPGNPYQQYSLQADAWQLLVALQNVPTSLFDPGTQWPAYQATVTVDA